MKKTILTFLLLCLITYPAFAQVSVGVKTSIPFFNGSRFTGSYGVNIKDIDYQGYFGILNAGLFCHYPLRNNWGIQTEFLIKNQGFKYQSPNDFDGASWDGTFRLDYLEMPFLLQYEGRSQFRLFAQAGLSIKYLIKANHSLHRWGSQDGGVSVNDSENVKEVFNNWVLVANVGGGIMYDISDNLLLTADLRFGYDITSASKNINLVSKTDDIWHFKNTRIFQMALSVGIGYKF